MSTETDIVEVEYEMVGGVHFVTSKVVKGLCASGATAEDVYDEVSEQLSVLLSEAAGANVVCTPAHSIDAFKEWIAAETEHHSKLATETFVPLMSAKIVWKQALAA